MVKKKGRIGQIHFVTNATFGGYATTEDYSLVNFEVIDLAKRMKLEIPKGAIGIWATLFNVPGANRVQVNIQLESNAHEDSYPIICYDKTELFSDKTCDTRLKKWVGKLVYLEVEYLEA